jgi:hypothetical protein
VPSLKMARTSSLSCRRNGADLRTIGSSAAKDLADNGGAAGYRCTCESPAFFEVRYDRSFGCLLTRSRKRS